MHKFIERLQKKSLPNQLRVKVQSETAQAIQNLINQAPEIPHGGKLIANIEVVDGEVALELGVKSTPVALPA